MKKIEERKRERKRGGERDGDSSRVLEKLSWVGIESGGSYSGGLI